MSSADVEDDEFPPDGIAVVVDTNTIAHGPWLLTSAGWKVLLDRCTQGRLRLIVPEVVLREVIGQYKAQLIKRLEAHSASTLALREFLNTRVKPAKKFDVGELLNEYETYFRQSLKTAGAEVPPLPDLDIADLIGRAIERRPPFNPEGSGFRDAVVWASVVEVAADETVSRVFLVSGDKSAFGGGTLSASLAGEVEHLCPVRLCHSVDEFLRRTGVSDPKAELEVSTAVSAQQDLLVSLVEAALDSRTLPSTRPLRAQVVACDDMTVSKLDTVVPSEDTDLLLVNLRIDALLTVEYSRTDEDEVVPAKLSYPFSLTAESTYSRNSKTFADLRLELPALESVGHLVDAFAAAEARRAGRTERPSPSSAPADRLSEDWWRSMRAAAAPFTAEQLESMRAAMPPISWKELELMRAAMEPISPEQLESVRAAMPPIPWKELELMRAAVPPISPEQLESMRAAIPPISPEHLESMRAAVPPISPEQLEAIRQVFKRLG